MNLRSLPKISVVIPCYNEEDWVLRAISSVKSQDYPGGYEIIVVDNASTDSTAQIASEAGARVVYEEKRGLPSARNAGYKAAKEEIIAYLDADSIAPTNWLRSLTEPFFNKEIIAVSGGFELEKSKKLTHRCFLKFYYKFCEPIFIWLAKNIMGTIPFAGMNFAVRKSALDLVGGFDDSIPFWGEDIAIPIRLKSAGKMTRIPFRVITSARRYNQHGIIKSFSIYALNYLSILFFNKPFSKDYGDLRSKLTPNHPRD